MKTRGTVVRTGTKIGAALGGLSFLLFGVIPGFYFGSYGAMVVMKHLMGTGLEPSVVVRMVVAVGSMLGIVCVGSVHLVVGSIVGTAVGYMAASITTPSEGKAPAAEAVKVR
ncbi:MAG: hypothetical protein U0411_12150 [Thermodesulfovibrionales bacterium]